jgi:hypothetical protein
VRSPEPPGDGLSVMVAPRSHVRRSPSAPAFPQRNSGIDDRLIGAATLRCFYECQVVIGRGWVAVRSRKSSRLM